MKFLTLPALLLALSAPCWGQSYVQSDLIDGPKAVAVGELFKVKIQGDLPYKLDPEPVSIDEVLDRKGNLLLLVVVGEPGELKISVDYRVVHPTEDELSKAPTVPDPKDAAQVKAFKDYFKAHSADEFYSDLHTVKVGKGPDPGPDPEPDPDVKPPIPEPGFRVLMLYETEMKEKLPVLQKAVLFGVEVRNYLDKTCVSEPDGGKAYRIYDKDQDASGDYPVWKTAMERRPESIPWLIVSNGKTGYEGPLPESPTAFLELCKKYEVK